MNLVFAIEKVKDVLHELMPLWEAHWKETEMYRDGQGFNMDVERYIKYNDVGYYILYTARDGSKLVGNLGIYLSHSMHTKQIIATEDTLFLLQKYRKGFTSINFIRFVEKDLVARGATEMSITVKSKEVGRLLEFIGYKPVAYQYSKSIEENYVLIKSSSAA